MNKKAIAAVALLLSGCGPKNYDDCILQNMKGINDKTAANAIIISCQDKFAEKLPSEKQCTRKELSDVEKLKVQITSKGGFQLLTFAIYNGNERIRLKEIKFEITADNFQAPQVYTRSLELGPQQGSDREYLHVADLPRGKWSYKILSIKGCDE